MSIIDKPIAAINFFTRIPVWKIKEIPVESYNKLVVYWSMSGWITSLTMILTLIGFSFILPYELAVILAIISRLLLTGALHEDGFADFLDGFGGGRTKEKILSIMKDSHIGSYGVIGLIVYYLTIFTILKLLPLSYACIMIFTADTFSKFISSGIINQLSYVREKEKSKTGIVYDKMTGSEKFFSALFGTLPLLVLITVNPILIFSVILPIITYNLFIRYINKKIDGYTGDCCGALFILCEVAFYVNFVILFNIDNL